MRYHDIMLPRCLQKGSGEQCLLAYLSSNSRFLTIFQGDFIWNRPACISLTKIPTNAILIYIRESTFCSEGLIVGDK